MSIDTRLADWKRRLRAMADNLPYSYLDTPQNLIDREYARLTTFTGFTESEVADAERRMGLRFPSVFRGFLQQMAKSPGDLFCGMDLADLSELEEFNAYALELMSKNDPVLSLSPQAIVFLLVQGYQFMYFVPTGEPDTPVMFWEEGMPEPRQEAASFVQFVEDTLEALERNNRRSHNREHFVTLKPEGGWQMLSPAAGETPAEANASIQELLKDIPMVRREPARSLSSLLRRLWNYLSFR